MRNPFNAVELLDCSKCTRPFFRTTGSKRDVCAICRLEKRKADALAALATVEADIGAARQGQTELIAYLSLRHEDQRPQGRPEELPPAAVLDAEHSNGSLLGAE